MSADRTRREAQRRFLEILAEAELPPPDEIHWEEESTVLLWNEIKFAVYLDPDRDDVSPIDELEAAQLRGLPVDEWPFPTADGYRDYASGASDTQ
jgi:hypothetical protein